MSLLLGTLIALCFLALALGLRIILGVGALDAGCDGSGSSRGCAACPNRGRSGDCKKSVGAKAESE